MHYLILGYFKVARLSVYLIKHTPLWSGMNWAQRPIDFYWPYLATFQGKGAEACSLGCVVSLGTGRIPVSDVKNMDVFRPEGILDAYRAVSGAVSLSRMLIDQVTKSHFCECFCQVWGLIETDLKCVRVVMDLLSRKHSVVLVLPGRPTVLQTFVTLNKWL